MLHDANIPAPIFPSRFGRHDRPQRHLFALRLSAKPVEARALAKLELQEHCLQSVPAPLNDFDCTNGVDHLSRASITSGSNDVCEDSVQYGSRSSSADSAATGNP